MAPMAYAVHSFLVDGSISLMAEADSRQPSLGVPGSVPGGKLTPAKRPGEKGQGRPWGLDIGGTEPTWLF